VKTIIYTGPGHVLAAGKHRIRRGVPTEISDELYKQLARDPSMTLQVIADPEPANRTATKADEHADSGEED
jgi:hypothetical protein